MKTNRIRLILPSIIILLAILAACSPKATSVPTAAPPTFTPVAPVAHQMRPADTAPLGAWVYDTVSAGTAPEKRAPYGDSYEINRLERPFLQDMSYVPDLDLMGYAVGQDSAWYYVTIVLVGSDPNNKLGIDYAVEIDPNHDGYGDYIIWGQPPYPPSWDTLPVKAFQDSNHDTGGLSAEKSDAPLSGTGYDTQVFSGGLGDADPDLAWVRAKAGTPGVVQFAFKKAWLGSVFMLGVFADAGWKDPKKLDYVDRITLAEAGSPVRDNSNYPLKAVFAVDNVCREAFGFTATGFEPQLCPKEETATLEEQATPTVEPAITEPPAATATEGASPTEPAAATEVPPATATEPPTPAQLPAGATATATPG